MKNFIALTLSLMTLSSTALSSEYCLSSFKANLNFGNALFDVRCDSGRKFLIEVEDSVWELITSGPQKRAENKKNIITTSNKILSNEGFDSKDMSYMPHLNGTSILRKSTEAASQNKNLCLVTRAQYAAPPSSTPKINYNIFCEKNNNTYFIGTNVNSLDEIHAHMAQKGYSHKATLDVNEKDYRAKLIYEQF